MLAIGLMSGTSLDGIDAVLCDIKGFGQDTEVKQLDFLILPMPQDVKEEIRLVCLDQVATTRHICSLNFKLGKCFAQAVNLLLERNHLDPEHVGFIASHGQTIYHLPHPESGEEASTLQIGEAAVIAYETKIQVIDDFRVMDIAAGGEGAPLVPYSESVLYAQKGKTIGLQNIGGIGNITILNDDSILAFDTGPGNMMIDEAMHSLFARSYDANGDTASIGKIHYELFSELCDHPYLKLMPPKSTGREAFGQAYVQNLLEKYHGIKAEDIIATFTRFTAFCIYDSIKSIAKLDRLIIGGGGAHNACLIKDIQSYFPETEVLRQEDLGYSSDAKEAIAFVILGNQTLHRQPSNVPSATGAKSLVILGKITPVPTAF